MAKRADEQANSDEISDTNSGANYSGDKGTGKTQTAQLNMDAGEQEVGEVTLPEAGAAGSPSPHARKARGKRWEQVRREARGSGSTRREAIAHANAVCAAEFPALASEYPLPPAPEAVEPEAPARAAPEAPESGVTGLGDLPASWPALPPNASLAAEIQWVQASRLDVIEELPGGVIRVHLDQARSPAPSRAAIGWLETSIRAYSKYCDIAARATAQLEDEREHVRRERIAIDEVRSLLAEMVDGER